MKSLQVFLIAIVSVVSYQLLGQEADKFVVENDRDSQIERNLNFVPGEVLLKFKDDVEITPEILEKKSFVSKGLNSVLSEISLKKAEKLFPQEKQVKSKKTVRTPQGTEMDVPSLHNIYKLTLWEDSTSKGISSDIQEIIQDLNQLPEVEYAELNYIYSIGDFIPASDVMTQAEVESRTNENFKDKAQKGLMPDDPLYGSQWGIPAIHCDDVWEEHTGNGSSVITILDTGVDWLHPDLEDNIWSNPDEIPGNGKDDDGNGFIDDIRGWDFINSDNNPMDDNSHGTHCAGIAAARGNNGKGIAGVNWYARIMPVKVFQSTGTGDAATISQGINYSAQNGASVISMSFGSYSESLTMRSALANAYATAALVAAAGNDGLCIGPGLCPDYRPGQPMFPGGFSFVLGVEAPPYPPIGFTNYDQDGPVFSAYSDSWNYELKGPGTGILSCIRGGNYRSYSGTSMATPFISGAVALYREMNPADSQELMWGNLINSSAGHLHLYNAIHHPDPIPVLNVTKYTLTDTLPGGDSDFKPDAGETVQVEIFVRNTWGTADSVYVGIEFEVLEDTTTAEILQSEQYIGSIGSYGTLSNFLDPLEVRISQNVVHGRDIRFKLLTWRGKDREYLTSAPMIITVEHGTELFGIIDDTLRLKADKYWIVSNSFKIGPNGVLILDPGSTLKIEKTITNQGEIIGIGKADSIIHILGPESLAGGRLTFGHTHFHDFDRHIFYYTSNSSLNNCLIENDRPSSYVLIYGNTNLNFIDCEFVNWGSDVYPIIYNGSGSLFYCNFYNIKEDLPGGLNYYPNNWLHKYNNFSNSTLPILSNNIQESNILTSRFGILANEGLYADLPNMYWGTLDSVLISKKIYDFWDESRLALLNIHPILDKPTPLAHGCVWKVVVNGFDAQDEFAQLDPLGVGKHKFEIYFNRPMDVEYTPVVSMGVRFPYNQVSVNEEGVWSPDSLVYTVYKTLGLSQSDGIHRIQIIGGKDTEGFDLIPENERFNVNIQSQGSLSTGFMATPGMGKVDLEWGSPEEHVSDLFGYNMYRYTFINDSTTTDTLLINSTMITDTLYTDFDVVPGTSYFYAYRTIRTDFAESAFSNIVAATPYTAAKGDANGDLSVNVSDVVSTVSYILMNNPQPFIFEAADMNTDYVINVLDVTGIVNEILNPAKSGQGNTGGGTASVYLLNDTLYINTDVPVAGIQFTFHNIRSDGYTVLPALSGFERASLFKGDTLLFLAYSMTGKTIGPGLIPVIKLASKTTTLDNIILSNAKGASITSTITDISDLAYYAKEMNSFFEIQQNYPNPFRRETVITYWLERPVDEIVFTVHNSLGQTIEAIIIENPVEGINQFTWIPATGPGLYFGKMSVKLPGGGMAEKTIKMIVQ